MIAPADERAEKYLRFLAAEALVAWRRQWERTTCAPPDLPSGHTRNDLRLWRIAGELMKMRGMKCRLP